MSRLPAKERREQLLDKAAGLFAERGYSGATTAELAKAAGVTEPIIYRHFASKKDLFIALIRRTGVDTIRLWKDYLGDAPTPAERLARLIGANPMVLDQGRGVYRVIVQAMTESQDDDVREALHEHIAALHAFLTEQIEVAQESGAVSKRFTPSITAWLLLHLGLGYGMLAALNVPGHAVDADGKHKHVRDAIEELMLGRREG
ncbi:MAG: TetR/AcrR family transcriptional regulator [Phycisphaerales bacterium]|nr:MAG: TetR/AcrR family transcriptional regulator [Phycisphaerales bacterium]